MGHYLSPTLITLGTFFFFFFFFFAFSAISFLFQTLASRMMTKSMALSLLLITAMAWVSDGLPIDADSDANSELEAILEADPGSEADLESDADLSRIAREIAGWGEDEAEDEDFEEDEEAKAEAEADTIRAADEKVPPVIRYGQ